MLLELVAHGRLRPLVSTAMFFEYEDVLMRPATQLAARMVPEDVQAILAELLEELKS